MKFNNLVKKILEQADIPPAHIQQYDLSERDKNILATLLVKEAGGEKDYVAGMAGVMNVIYNRASIVTGKPDRKSIRLNSSH